MTLLKKMIMGGIILAIIFVLLGNLIMPQFSTAWRYAQDLCWTNVTASCDYDTTVNTTVITNANTCTGSGYAQGDLCQAVQTAGGYRVANQGLMILILIIALIGFALTFWSKR